MAIAGRQKNAAETVDAVSLSVRDLRGRFVVSRDQEHVSVELTGRGRAIQLGHRAHHDVLLALARARVEDTEQKLAASEAGWIHIEDLSRAVRLEPERINVDVFRARQQLAEAGVADAMTFVERRRGVRQLRIGVADIVIDAM